MGFFDDVTSIVINNKEVQSIITSDGGIIYEKPSGYNLTLTADKSIIQTNELCTLSATLTNNNVPMANQTIVFNGLEYTETLEANTEITVGDTYRFTSIPSLSSSDRIYLNEEQTIYITSDSMGNKKLVINGEAPYNQQYLDLFYVENGIIYYQRTNDSLRHYDASSTNTNKITSTVSNVIIEEYAKAVTDANGVASVGYYGKGTGDLSIQADWEGRIQSEIFVIEDCIYYNGNISSNTTFDISIPNDFEISFRLTRASNSGNGAWIILQKDGHDSAMIGQVGGNGTSQCRIYTDTSGSNIPHSTSNTPLNQEALITLRHNGSDYEYSMNDSKQIWTDSYTHSVLKSATIVNSPIKDLKVKPL